MIHDKRIRELIKNGHLKVTPFIGTKMRVVSEEDATRAISYGLGSCGLDLRLGDTLLVFKDGQAKRREAFAEQDLDALNKLIIDPLEIDEAWQETMFIKAEAKIDGKNRKHFILPPHTYALGVLKEHLDFPADMSALFIGKSTYARAGLIVNCTPAEPGWRGHLTVELFNAATLPMKLYADMGICQALFFEFPSNVEEDYDKTQGKYQDQEDRPVPSRP